MARRRPRTKNALTEMMKPYSAPTPRNYQRPSGFEVRFAGTCDLCPDPLRVGQRAVMRHGKAIHVGCAPGADDV